jgi:hypothetical protein
LLITLLASWGWVFGPVIQCHYAHALHKNTE